MNFEEFLFWCGISITLGMCMVLGCFIGLAVIYGIKQILTKGIEK